MKKTLLFAFAIVLAVFVTSCDKDDDATPTSYDLTGKWANVGDENDVFTFNADKTGDYTYSYLTETNPDDPEERHEDCDPFNLYLVEYIADGTYELTFFADSDFPIYNASFKIVEGYLKITYDWSDTEGHFVENVIEAYKRIE